MTVLEAIILGFVQGVAEFLPISSTGHLMLVQKLLGIRESTFMFAVIVHVATLCSTLIIFRKKIKQLIGSLFKSPHRRRHQDHIHIQIILRICITTFVTGVLGFMFKDFFEAQFKDIKSIGLGLFFTGMLLLSMRWIKLSKHIPVSKLPYFKSVLIGLSQTLALLPGVSRAGSTIASGLLVGLNRKDAGEYAFLISIPVILGALLLEIKNIQLVGFSSMGVLTAGFVTAFVTGIIALKLLLGWIQSGKLYIFGIYCCVVAVFIFIYF